MRRRARGAVLAALAFAALVLAPPVRAGAPDPAGPTPRNPAGSTPRDPAGPTPRNPAGAPPLLGAPPASDHRGAGRGSHAGDGGGFRGHAHAPGCGHLAGSAGTGGSRTRRGTAVVVVNPAGGDSFPRGANFYCAVHGVGFSAEEAFAAHLAEVDRVALDLAAQALVEEDGVRLFPGLP